MASRREKTDRRLVEALTPREQDILLLLAKHLRYQDIADQLTMAISSVKWYVNQIYSKLGVENRRDAIQRAQALGLLETEHPAIPVSLPAHNLPRQLTRFIGREKEIAQLMELVRQNPLVMLTGTGGVGKTRLAYRVAEALREEFRDGVWLVELAPLADPELVAQAAATALNIHPAPDQTAAQSLCEYLSPKHLLLLLDNCEHVVRAAAELADTLLRACPHLHILATSRELLGVSGEMLYRCPSLSVPGPQSEPSPAKIGQYEAVRLFIERATTASPDFHFSEGNAVFIAQICRQLDGIPLAIELAAARVRLLSVEQIADRLEHVFYLLTAGSRTALPRHQTLKALIDWSYQLLSEKESTLLRRLAVFAGGWTLQAAEAVCTDEGTVGLAGAEILDLLGQLVDKSLAITDAQRENIRYRMLETIRQYARERMGNDEWTWVRGRHLEYFLAFALQAELHLRGKGQRGWLDRLEMELDNLRQALEFALTNDIEKGMQLATALDWFWHFRTQHREGTSWLYRLLTAEASATVGQPRTPARSLLRGKALNALANNLTNWNKNEEAIPLLEEARNIFQTLGDGSQRDLAISLYYLAFIEKDLERAITGMKQAVNVLQKEGDQLLLADGLQFFSQLQITKGDFPEARANAEEVLQMYRETEDKEGEGATLLTLGLLELVLGNLPQATHQFIEAKACYDEAGDLAMSILLLNSLSYTALVQGDYPQALQGYNAMLSTAGTLLENQKFRETLGLLALAAWAMKDYDQAVLHSKKALELAVAPDSWIEPEYVLGRVALSQREYSQSDAFFKNMLLNWAQPGHIFFRYYRQGLALSALAVLAAAQDQAHRAAILFGAQDRLCGWLKNMLSLAEREENEQALVVVRAALGKDAFTAAWEKGRTMTVDETIQYALEERNHRILFVSPP